LPKPLAAAPLGSPVVVSITPIRGPERAYQPGAGLADLDHGFAAGATRYLHDDGIIYNDTRACFLWSQDGTTTLFEPSHDLNTTRSVYFAHQITPDGSKVAGSVAFLNTRTTAPWIGERDAGLKYLPLLPNYSGTTIAISNDGRLAAGTLFGGGFNPPPSQAAVWLDGVLQTLPSAQLWSEVAGVSEPHLPPNPHPMSSDGSIIVGASGPASDQLQATKWVNSVEVPLSTGDPQTQSSIALFVTDDGIVFGTAIGTDGRVRMVRWDSDGTPQILEPPNGLSIITLNAVDRSGTVAGGSLALSTSCIQLPDPACNQSPFVWTASGGFTILPENGHQDFYDLSTVTAVSDNGRVVVGALRASTRTDGDPPDVGFGWSADTGLTLITDIICQPNPDYSSTDQVSSDGHRVMDTGYSSNSGNTLSVFNRYDPVADTWTTLSDMPTAAFMASAVYYPPGDKIYVFGGEDADSGVNYNVTRIYDIASQTWSTGANMPDVRSFMASGYNSDNGKIYLVSGYNTGDVTSAQPDIWEYDPVTDSFTERTPIPHAVGGAAFGIINGHLYVAGGRDGTDTVVNLVWDYDIAANTWTQKTEMPAIQNNVPGSAVALGRLWAFGGGNPFGPAREDSTTAASPKRQGSAPATNTFRRKNKNRTPDRTSASYI